MAGGLIREAGWDYFQGRLLWPIRDSGRQVLGFGARRLRDDDRMPAKYLNTPETPLYKKSHVLYGLDLARQQIGKKSQAVVVEGYTDVMAAHVAGVDTAVASCGTAFGDDHARLLRRLMGNHDAFRGEVIFTFDGDAAGQAAALKVFGGDANFIAQTYVAVEPSGLDPCDLRLQHGDAAVRELVARRVPLYRFVMANILTQHDLDRADGRLSALREAAPLVSSIRDSGLDRWLRRASSPGMLGMDVEEVRREVMRSAARHERSEQRSRQSGSRDTERTDRPRGRPPRPQASSRRPSLAARAGRPAAGHRARDHQAAAAGAASCSSRTGSVWTPTTSPTARTPPCSASMQAARSDGETRAAGRSGCTRSPPPCPTRARPAGRLPRGRAVVAARPGRPSTTSQANAAKLRLLTVMRQVERAEVQAAAHQSGGEPDHVQPDVLRARGARGPAQSSCTPRACAAQTELRTERRSRPGDRPGFCG